jgi:hypothetical protein
MCGKERQSLIIASWDIDSSQVIAMGLHNSSLIHSRPPTGDQKAMQDSSFALAQSHLFHILAAKANEITCLKDGFTQNSGPRPGMISGMIFRARRPPAQLLSMFLRDRLRAGSIPQFSETLENRMVAAPCNW